MRQILEPYYDFFAQPVSVTARVLLVVGLLPLILVFRTPLWTMSFRSNQYPDPLKMAIHINHLEGQKSELRDDLREINSLNHYIGMRPLLESDFSEFQWLPLALGIFALLALRIAFFGRLRDLVDLTVVFLYFAIYSAWDFYMRLYGYGHNLAPDAAIKIDPFTPPIFGTVKVANFWVQSYPGGGSYAMATFAGLLVLSLLVALYRGRIWYGKHKQVALGAATVVVAVILSIPLIASRADAAELRIGSGGIHSTLQSALRAANPGDTLTLTGGTYTGPFEVSTPVTITGEPGAVLDGGGKADAVLVTADNVTLQRLTIRRSGGEMMDSDAGVKIRGDHCIVTECQLRDNLFGVYLQSCKDARIEHNNIRGRAELTIGSRGAGVHIYNASHNTIRGNDVAVVRDGVYFDHADYNLVEDNDFHNLRYGVHYMYCRDNNFYRNTFRDSVAGVAIMYTDNVNFSDNEIINNRNGFNAFGLLFQACRNCHAERNVIVNNTQGIFLEGARNNVFRNNLVAYNDVGVYVFGSSSNNSFSSNDFVGNISLLQTVGRIDEQWNSAGSGNYYSDYDGYDLNADGRGDVRAKLQDAFEALEGNHPLLRLYLSSAAADALRLAERSFPLLQSSGQFDTAPSMRPLSGVRVKTRAKKQNSVPAVAACLALSAISMAFYWRAGK